LRGRSTAHWEEGPSVGCVAATLIFSSARKELAQRPKLRHNDCPQEVEFALQEDIPMEPSMHPFRPAFHATTHRAPGAPLLLLVVTLCLIVPAYAGSIEGSFDGNATLTPTSTPGVFFQNFTGDGTDTRFGAFDLSSMSTVDFSNPPHIVITDSMLTETFSDGALFGIGSGTGTGNGNGMATFMIDFVITGGTGIFAGDHGSVMAMGTITQTGPLTEAVSNATYRGTLVTPEPSSLGLLFLGASMGYRFLVKRRLG
jgi:hypothetical protein